MSGIDNFLVCPSCRQRTRSKVVDSRGTKAGSWVRRRRECPCGQRFTTIETVLDADTIRPGVKVSEIMSEMVRALRML